ncbi:MAG: acetyl-CoA carboxylase biotin carboxyl carrier protein [Gammaproteobacteria bacterium]|jgi:acetyl-CoA carboxylase biotin carboxyl carrier protein|nr:acetyl-CoA carboxylase biotin carboxyl carrier protein [Gammaproteobacteria bacterium]
MDIRKIKKLIELLEESDLAEIEVQEGEASVRISRYGKSAPVAAHMVAQAPMPVAAPAASAPVAAEASSAAAPAQPSGHVITSPIVGSFYRAPAPGAPPFVEVGQRVKVGDTLCVIEAMKMMNQIESDKDGVVAAIMVENGQPVEYGQPIFVIE